MLYYDNSKLSDIMSKLLLLKVKVRRIDIPVSEIGRNFQIFSDEGLGGDDEYLCGSTLSINALFGKKNRTHCGISPIDQLRSSFHLPSKAVKI